MGHSTHSKHSKRHRRHRSPSMSSSSSDSSRSRSRSRSRSHHKRTKRSRASRSPSSSRSPPRTKHPKSPTKKPYTAPTEPGICTKCSKPCKFTVASDNNKEHAGWPYWKCPKCPGRDSFNGWIHEGPLPPNAPKGVPPPTDAPPAVGAFATNMDFRAAVQAEVAKLLAQTTTATSNTPAVVPSPTDSAATDSSAATDDSTNATPAKTTPAKPTPGKRTNKKEKL